MPITTERTHFTRDVQGRYLCNTLDEAIASTDQAARADARPFDMVVIGGGTFGGVFAQHLLARDVTRRHRILVLEAGPFLVPEHVQNLPMAGLNVPAPSSIQDLRASGQFDRPREEVWGLAWHSGTKFTGLAYCVGGRSLYWGGWSPVLLDSELAGWPPALVQDFKGQYFREAAEQIGVTDANDFINGRLHERLRAMLRAGIDQNKIAGGIPLSELPDQVDVPADVPAADRPAWKLEAPLAVQAQTRAGFFPANKFSVLPLLTKAVRAAYAEAGGDDVRRRLMVVPNCHIKALRASGNRVVAVETGSGVIPIPENGTVVVALGTIESARLILAATGASPGQVGKNLMAHVRSNLTIRVPRAALEAAGSLPTELAASALFVKGKTALAGGPGHFHLQITAAGLGPSGIDSEAELFKKVPDLDGFEVLRQATDTHLVMTIRGIGEMQPNNPASNVTLDTEPDEYGVRRAFVSIQAGVPDQAVWDAMDRAADDAALVFANGQAYEVLIAGQWRPVAAGAKAVTVLPFAARRDVLGSTHHEAGTLAMGESPTAPTDPDGRLRALTNAVAIGPATFPRIGSPNPMLTGVAQCRRLADRLTSGDLIKPDSGFDTLFDGSESSFRGWQSVGAGSFSLADGQIIAEPGGDLGLLFYDAKRFGDFTLRLQFKLSGPGDNSGVFVRFRDPRLPVPDRSPGVAPHEYGNRAWVPVTTGFEIQIDQIGQPDGARQHQTGAIYNIPPGSARGQQSCGPVPPVQPGAWNDMEITVRGDTYTVRVNGVQTAAFTNADSSRGKAPAADSASGFVGLQAHTGRVAFRTIGIKAAGAGPGPSADSLASMAEPKLEEPVAATPRRSSR